MGKVNLVHIVLEVLMHIFISYNSWTLLWNSLLGLDIKEGKNIPISFSS